MLLHDVFFMAFVTGVIRFMLSPHGVLERFSFNVLLEQLLCEHLSN